MVRVGIVIIIVGMAYGVTQASSPEYACALSRQDVLRANPVLLVSNTVDNEHKKYEQKVQKQLVSLLLPAQQEQQLVQQPAAQLALVHQLPQQAVGVNQVNRRLAVLMGHLSNH